MKLRLINESVDINILIRILTNIGIDISEYMVKSNTLSYVVIPLELLDKVKYILKRSGWQIHLSGNLRGKSEIVSITPLRAQKYKHNAKKLYHITDSRNIYNIMQHGLKLKSDTPGINYPKRIYLYPVYERALRVLKMAKSVKSFANKRMNDPILLEIDNSDGLIKLRVDPECFLDIFSSCGDQDEDLAIYTTSNIPPDRIKVV